MTISPDFKFMLARPAHFIALGFGSGLAPKAPGTFGTLVGFPVYFLLQALSPNMASLVALLAAGFILGIWASARTSRALGVADHGAIVWDEIIAFAMVLSVTPVSVLWYGVAFAAFRFFDILKPWPIRQFDARLKNGFGVMFDDVLAAFYAVVVIKGLQWLV
ncbi:MAG: phosphatidylglycerophosphatase A [Thiobacillaceae bacterium]